MSSNFQNQRASGAKLTWNIETKECGIWETVETADSELEALRIASTLTLTTREEWVRVVDPNNKVL